MIPVNPLILLVFATLWLVGILILLAKARKAKEAVVAAETHVAELEERCEYLYNQFSAKNDEYNNIATLYGNVTRNYLDVKKVNDALIAKDLLQTTWNNKFKEAATKNNKEHIKVGTLWASDDGRFVGSIGSPAAIKKAKENNSPVDIYVLG